MKLEILLFTVEFCKPTLGKTLQGSDAVERFDLLQLFLKATQYSPNVVFDDALS